MPLIDLDVAIAEVALPGEARRFLREADRRIARFQADCRVPAFVPGDYAGSYRVLRTLSDGALTRGRQFCEWGSGFGVVAGLAAMLEFDSCGIEVEQVLVEEAQQLTDYFGLPVEFVQGSFVPRGAEDRVHFGGTYSWLTTDGDHAYDELGLDVSDMDVVFAYPWPDEEAVVSDLFERYAGVGAVLATYHSNAEFRLRRKIDRRKRRR
jgi:hypothetical protein